MDYIIQIITGLLGSLGFAVIFNIKKLNIWVSAVGGGISWSIYLLSFYFTNNEVISYFISSLLTTIYAEILARIKKSPATIILICSVVPLIPGSALYYTMRYAFNDNWEQFSVYGLNTLKLAIALALGVIVVSTLLKMYSNLRNQIK